MSLATIFTWFYYLQMSFANFVFKYKCRMSRVCQSWKQVASETMLWREVNLSTMSIECPRSAIDSTIVKLAVSRLKTVRELNLDGWSELTDVGLKVGKECSASKHGN